MPDAPVNVVFGFLMGLMRRQFYFVGFCFLLLAGMAMVAGDLSTSMIVMLIVFAFALIFFAMLIWFWSAAFSSFSKSRSDNVSGPKQ
jgi:uncharacterized membrane protein